MGRDRIISMACRVLYPKPPKPPEPECSREADYLRKLGALDDSDAQQPQALHPRGLGFRLPKWRMKWDRRCRAKRKQGLDRNSMGYTGP